MAMGAAREKVRGAHALAGLPLISSAMSRGQRSYSKARELTRVACCNTESYLLNSAPHGTADHVEKVVRHFRRAKEAAELSREAARQANRFLSWHYDADGGETTQSNLLSLRRFHHRLVHEGGIAIERLPDGAVRFVRPTGQGVETRVTQRTCDWTLIRSPDIQSSSAMTRWCGERKDHGLAVEELLSQSLS